MKYNFDEMISRRNTNCIKWDRGEKACNPKVKLMLLCSPHNPVGRVWTKEELVKVGNICEKHGVLVIADEIHCDLIYK